MRADFEMDPPGRSDRPPETGGHSLASALDRNADQPGSAAEPEVAGHRLGESPTLFACDRSSLTVTSRFCLRLVTIELEEPTLRSMATPVRSKFGEAWANVRLRSASSSPTTRHPRPLDDRVGAHDAIGSSRWRIQAVIASPISSGLSS